MVVAGGPLTAEASAYLLDPSIADKMIIAWLGGQEKSMGDYNGWADPWAAYVVLQRLRLVQFPLRIGPPSVPKAELLGLPSGPLREYMYRKQHPTNGDPKEIDGDGPPAISVMRSDFPVVVKRVAFRKWIDYKGHEVPAFSVDTNGKALVVVKSDEKVATSEWWGTLPEPPYPPRFLIDPRRAVQPLRLCGKWNPEHLLSVSDCLCITARSTSSML